MQLQSLQKEVRRAQSPQRKHPYVSMEIKLALRKIGRKDGKMGDFRDEDSKQNPSSSSHSESFCL